MFTSGFAIARVLASQTAGFRPSGASLREVLRRRLDSPQPLGCVRLALGMPTPGPS